jgi:hypothetical protein
VSANGLLDIAFSWKIAKFAKRENKVPFAVFAAFCSNLLVPYRYS